MWTLLPEFLNDNMHRSFPLDDTATGVDTTASFQMPQSLMVDMILNVPYSADVTKFFVSNVVFRRYSLDISVGYDKGGATITVGTFANIPVDQLANTLYYISALNQPLVADSEFEQLNGAVIIGRTEEAVKYPGSWTFLPATGKIISTCINRGLVGVRQIKVGDEVFTGKVALKEGNNVTLTSTFDPVNNETVIQIAATNNLNSAISIASDADIIAALVANYGRPVTTINNIKPDVSGNFKVQGLDCTTIATAAGLVTINNPCAKPCCDTTYLTGAYEGLADLNSRYGRILEFYNNLSSVLNDMQNQLAILQLNAQQQ
jgi:hypothetical protein